MVSGFSSRASTMRSRNCAVDQRCPAPELPVGDYGPPARRVSGRVGQGIGQTVADDPAARHLPGRIRLRHGGAETQHCGKQPHSGFGHARLQGHARLRSWFFRGRSRMRLPVAAKTALSTAGAATAIVGSPTPPQNPPEATMMVSTRGISSILSTG